MDTDNLMVLLSKGDLQAGPALLGWQFFCREPDSQDVGGTIVETEAYTQDDTASHSYHGITPRSAIMFGPSGWLYIYFSYGRHWCMNIVAGDEGRGEAILLRAILPQCGLELIRKRRGYQLDRQLTNGPAKLCQALAITGKDNGVLINASRFILLPPKSTEFNIKATPRIGISSAKDKPWCFVANIIK